MRPLPTLPLAFLLLAAGAAPAQEKSAPMEWTVEGTKREALVIPPRQTDGPVPVVFVFHGHGGSMRNMEQKGFPQFWPEALFVFPQGLPTATPRDLEGGRPGWQPTQGVNADRDLKFFDAMLTSLREKYKIDDARIYCTGHSNGGAFTYLLCAARPGVFAAIAPSAAGARGARDIKPVPVLHLAGQNDDVVPFATQMRTMEAMRRINGCDPAGQPWAQVGTITATQYPSRTGTPFVAAIHPGTHRYPEEAPEVIIKFFKEHSR